MRYICEYQIDALSTFFKSIFNYKLVCLFLTFAIRKYIKMVEAGVGETVYNDKLGVFNVDLKLSLKQPIVT